VTPRRAAALLTLRRLAVNGIPSGPAAAVDWSTLNSARTLANDAKVAIAERNPRRAASAARFAVTQLRRAIYGLGLGGPL
jgi:hypothetical protein